MTAKQLPSDSNRFDFRDPKVWKAADGSYRCVMVNCDNKGDGRAVLFESKDGFSWNFKSILTQNNGKILERCGSVQICLSWMERQF